MPKRITSASAPDLDTLKLYLEGHQRLIDEDMALWLLAEVSNLLEHAIDVRNAATWWRHD